MGIATLLSLQSLGYSPTRFFCVPQRSFYRDFASFGVVYCLAGMVIMSVAMTDKVVAAHYLAVSASAIYGVAALFVPAYWIVSHSFVLVWTPWLFKKLKAATDDGMREVISVSMLYLIPAPIAAIAFYFISLLAVSFRPSPNLSQYVVP